MTGVQTCALPIYFTAKDFRTWAGTVLALRALQHYPTFDSVAEAKRNVAAAIESVARTLGNTKAVCRKSYIHPTLIEAYLDGGSLARGAARRGKAAGGLRPEETEVLAILKARLASDARKA